MQEPEQDEDSLFMPAGDDERTWDPPNFDQDEEEEETLGWDATNEMRGSEPHPTFRDSGRAAPPARQAEQQKQNPSQWEDGLEPTQRLSQVRIFPIQLAAWTRTLTSNSAAWHVRLSEDDVPASRNVASHSRSCRSSQDEACCASPKYIYDLAGDTELIPLAFDVALIAGMLSAITMLAPAPSQDFSIQC